jgi:3-dehydroquinate dehydratase II
VSRIVHVLNGPNLDRLGVREPEIYGSATYGDLVGRIEAGANGLGMEIFVRQTAGEGELVTWIHEAGAEADGLLINAAAYTHTSVAVRDALLTLTIPVVEVHISNPDAREEFRRTNLLADVVTATVKGFGAYGYLLALEGLRALLDGDG